MSMPRTMGLMRWLTCLVAGAALAAPASADEFWSPREIAEIDGFSELDGIVKLSFKNAVTAKPVRDLRLDFGKEGILEGDGFGIVQFSSKLIANLDDYDLPFTATAPGHIPYDAALKVRLGSVLNKRFVLSPEMPVNQARMVVEWDKRPADIDAWLVGPNFTVSFRAMKNAAGNASLDRDARSGYGPETLTLLDIKPGADYLFSVQNYSHEAPLSSVRISLYLDNKLSKILVVPQTTAVKVDVMRIKNGKAEFLVK